MKANSGIGIRERLTLMFGAAFVMAAANCPIAHMSGTPCAPGNEAAHPTNGCKAKTCTSTPAGAKIIGCPVQFPNPGEGSTKECKQFSAPWACAWTNYPIIVYAGGKQTCDLSSPSPGLPTNGTCSQDKNDGPCRTGS